MTNEQIIAIYDDFYTQEDDCESDHILPFAHALLSASKPAVAEQIKITCEHDDRIELVEIVDAKRIDDVLHIAIRIDAAAPAQSGEPVDYDRVVSICDAHGIGLPVDCIEMVVEIIRISTRRGDDAIDAEDLEGLPAIARTKPGKRLYSLAYARGRARERLNASGALRATPRANAIDAPTRHEMRLMLPEGGHVNLFWPDELTADSAQMLSEMFATVMQAFARAAAATPAAPAASAGDLEVES